MSEITAYLSGRVVWCGETKTTRTGNPMRSALVAGEQDAPAVSCLLFGSEAEAVAVGDSIAVEGKLEASIRNDKQGQPQPALNILARWARLLGHAGKRTSNAQYRQQQGNGGQQGTARQRQTATDMQGRQDGHPAFDDAIPF